MYNHYLISSGKLVEDIFSHKFQNSGKNSGPSATSQNGDVARRGEATALMSTSTPRSTAPSDCVAPFDHEREEQVRGMLQQIRERGRRTGEQSGVDPLIVDVWRTCVPDAAALADEVVLDTVVRLARQRNEAGELDEFELHDAKVLMAQFMMRISSRLSHAALRTVVAASGKPQPEKCYASENETADIVQSLEEILERLKRQVPVRVAAFDPAMHHFPPSAPEVAWG